jgi:Holliday junction resolvasome RuvABC endonuclease subunit
LKANLKQKGNQDMERMERTKLRGQHPYMADLLTTGLCNILTNDPSMTAWGWAVVNAHGSVIACGCIKTAPEQKKRRIRKGDDTVRRASEIIQKLNSYIKHYQIKHILSELPHGSQNASAAVMIGMVTGIMQTLADVHNLGIEWYSEGDSKKALLGKLAATKDETIRAIHAKYDNWRTGVKYMDEAIADALSIHYCAMQQSPVLKMMKR